MEIDVSSLFDNSVTTEENTSGELMAEGSGVALIGYDDDNDGIKFNFRLTGNFNTNNYICIGFTDKPFTNGAASLSESAAYVWYDAQDEDYNYMNCFPILTQSDDLDDCFPKLSEGNYKGGYRLYGFAKAANGKYYQLANGGVGSYVEFWSSPKESFKIDSTNANSAHIKMKNLYQMADGVGANPIMGVTRVSPGYWDGEKEINGASVDFPELKGRDNGVKLSGLPSGRTFVMHLYRKDCLEYYWHLKSFTITTSTADKPLCTLNASFGPETISSGIFCSDYPKIRAQDFNQFCDDINTVRIKKGFSSETFTKVRQGDSMNCSAWDEVYSAIEEMDSTISIAPPTQYHTITKEWIYEIEDILIGLRDEVF